MLCRLSCTQRRNSVVTALLPRICVLASPIVLLIWFFQPHITSLPTRLYYGDCSTSLQESDHFICESDQLWNQRKSLYQHQDRENMVKREHKILFVNNWEPNFHCSHAVRIGHMGDGGKWLCDLFRLSSRPDCLVYSAGSNGDFSFEAAMKKAMPHCEIHTFDSNLFKCPVDVCTFHQMRLGNGQSPNGSKSWSMIIDELGHGDRTVDVFKIDIEGGEYDFFASFFTAKVRSFPRQVLVEVHHFVATQTHEFFESFRTNHYVIFSKEPNQLAPPNLFEYAFLRLNSKFFQ